MSVTVSGSRTAISFKGEEDSASAGPRRVAIRHCLSGRAEKVALDLGEATFLDASAVADLIHLAETLAKQDRRLEIRRCSHDVHKLLHMAGLSMIGSVQFTDHAAPHRVLKRQSV